MAAGDQAVNIKKYVAVKTNTYHLALLFHSLVSQFVEFLFTFKIRNLNWAWWCIPVIFTHSRWREEWISSLRAIWATQEDPVS
jgi:hypothetical protein